MSNGRDGSGGGGGGGGGDEVAPPLTYENVSPGGIRTKSRYVFPDGSVRSALGTVGGAGDTAAAAAAAVATAAEQGAAAATIGTRRDLGGVGRRVGEGGGETNGGGNRSVPLTLVGTARESVNLSAALGIDALGIDVLGGGGNGESLGRQETGTSGGSHKHGAYRGPGAAAGSEWAPGGRPPRAFVPFLNLPASNAKGGGSGHRRRRRKPGQISADADGGADFSPPVPSFVGLGDHAQTQRGRPLVGVGGVPVSPGRAMLTGPGRPGTGDSGISSPMFEDTEREEDGRRRRRRYRGGGSRGGGDEGCRHPRNDRESSDGCDSVASGSTDVEFLRRRAEAKLRSLQRREEENAVPGIDRAASLRS